MAERKYSYKEDLVCRFEMAKNSLQLLYQMMETSSPAFESGLACDLL